MHAGRVGVAPLVTQRRVAHINDDSPAHARRAGGLAQRGSMFGPDIQADEIRLGCARAPRRHLAIGQPRDMFAPMRTMLGARLSGLSQSRKMEGCHARHRPSGGTRRSITFTARSEQGRAWMVQTYHESTVRFAITNEVERQEANRFRNRVVEAGLTMPDLPSR